MTRFHASVMCTMLVLLCSTTVFCSPFDERLWEKYADLEMASQRGKGALAGIYLEPAFLGDMSAQSPFADLRLVNDLREEQPWQIVTRRPEKSQLEVPARMQNLSLDSSGDTWLELLPESQTARINAVEILTADSGFSRQVQVLGSTDGSSWNSIRKDGVIFDVSRGEKLHHTHISFPQTAFRHLALKISNSSGPPLNISGVKVLQESDSKGQSNSISAAIGKQETDLSRQESSLVVTMNSVFPLERLVITTSERNFQRFVQVQVKRGSGEWEAWGRGTIFSFDGSGMRESSMSVEFPEVSSREFRLVFRNMDSPALRVSGVSGEGYRKLLVFKQQPDRKLFLFWGNPQAKRPEYDLGQLVSRQNLDEIPLARLGQVTANTRFAGNSARLPFSERYKYLLYTVVCIAIAALAYLQFRVVRHTER